VSLSWANLHDNFRDNGIDDEALAFRILSAAAEECKKNDVSMEALVQYWQGFKDWVEDVEDRHIAECNDPECDWRCCRLARGWTDEEIRLDVEAAQRKHFARVRKEHLRKAMNR